MKHAPFRSTALVTACAAALAGCAVGPNYVRPSAPISPTFKETTGWSPAAPADTLDRGDWWTLFGDPILNGLESKVQIDNQNVVAAEAAYREARAIVAEDRAQLFPTLALDASGTRSGAGAGSTGSVITGAGGGTVVTGTGAGSKGGTIQTTQYRASLDAGRLGAHSAHH